MHTEIRRSRRQTRVGAGRCVGPQHARRRRAWPRRLGRLERHLVRRLRHWGPRTLDLDLLLYGELTLHQPRLTVPHGQMHARAFVLVPLVEVATALQHPITLHQQPLNHWLTAVNMSDIRHLNDTGVTATATI